MCQGRQKSESQPLQRQRTPTPQGAYERRSDVAFLRAVHGMCGAYAKVLTEAGAHFDAEVARGARSAPEAQRLRRNADRLRRHVQRHGQLCDQVGAELREARRLAEDAAGPARQRLDFASAQ